MWYIRKTMIKRTNEGEEIKEVLVKKEKERRFTKYFWLKGLVLEMKREELRFFLMVMEVIDYNWIFNFLWVLDRFWINYKSKKEYEKYYKGLKGLEKKGVIKKLTRWWYKLNSLYAGRGVDV